MIRVSNADYLARPLRLTPTEATAVIVALRALRDGAGDDDPRGRRPGAGQARGGGRRGRPRRRIDPGDDDPGPTDRRPAPRPASSEAAAPDRQVRLTYCVPVPRRGDRAGRRPARRGHRRTASTYLDAWCHSAEAPRLFRLDRIHAAEVLDTADRDPGRGAARPGRRAVPSRRRHHAGHPAARPPPARWVVEYYPVEEVRAAARRRPRGRPAGGRRALAAAGCCCGWPRTPGWSPRRSSPRRSRPPHRSTLSLYT